MSQPRYNIEFINNAAILSELNDKLAHLLEFKKTNNDEIKKVQEELQEIKERMNQASEDTMGSRFHKKSQLRANCMRINSEPPYNIEVYNQVDCEYVDAEGFANISLENCKKIMNVLEKNRTRIMRQHVEGLYKRILQLYVNFTMDIGRVEIELNITERGNRPFEFGGLPTVPERPFIIRDQDGGPVRARHQRREQRRTQPVERQRRSSRRPELVESQLYAESSHSFP